MVGFCPNAVAWGDVATWVAAVGTLAAVITALLTAGHAGRVAFKIQEDERKEKEKYETSLRQHLAVAFDQELFMAASALDDVFLPRLRNLQVRADWEAARRHIVEELPRRGFTMLDRFAHRLDVFPVDVASPLLALLGRWHFLKEAPESPALGAGVDFNRLVDSTLQALEGLSTDMNRAREIIRPYAPSNVRLMPLPPPGRAGEAIRA